MTYYNDRRFSRGSKKKLISNQTNICFNIINCMPKYEIKVGKNTEMNKTRSVCYKTGPAYSMRAVFRETRSAYLLSWLPLVSVCWWAIDGRWSTCESRIYRRLVSRLEAIGRSSATGHRGRPCRYRSVRASWRSRRQRCRATEAVSVRQIKRPPGTTALHDIKQVRDN